MRLSRSLSDLGSRSRAEASTRRTRLLDRNPLFRKTAWQGLLATILLHFLHPWRSDAGAIAHLDLGKGREQDAEALPNKQS